MTDRAPDKFAVLSMDVEDWHHLDYLREVPGLDRSISMFDGLERYLQLLADREITTTFFVLGSIARPYADMLRAMHAAGHEIACHGWAHQRPLTMTIDAFREDIRRAKGELEDIIGAEVIGHRAPCYSLDRAGLDVVREMGFRYDSSRIDFDQHPLYGHLDISDFTTVAPGVYRLDDFLEFEISTLRKANRMIPVSGTGYLRLIPWALMRGWIGEYTRSGRLYMFYTHPYEFSRLAYPLPRRLLDGRAFRFDIGRRTLGPKVEKLIALLAQSGYRIVTCADVVARIPRVAALA